MKVKRPRPDPANRPDHEYNRDTAMVFGPLFVVAAYVGILMLAVAASPPSLRAWTVGVGILLACLAGVVYLMWAFRVARRR